MSNIGKIMGQIIRLELCVAERRGDGIGTTRRQANTADLPIGIGMLEAGRYIQAHGTRADDAKLSALIAQIDVADAQRPMTLLEKTDRALWRYKKEANHG